MSNPGQELRNFGGGLVSTARSITGGLAGSIENVVRNPLPVIESAVLISFGVPPVMASAAVSAANGGNLEDIALAAAKSYAGQQIGSYAGNELAPNDFQTTDVQFSDAQLIKQVVTSASGSAAVAALSGQSLDKVLSAAASGAVYQYVSQDLQNMGINPGSLDNKLISNAVAKATDALMQGKSNIGEIIGKSSASIALGSAISSGVDTIKSNQTLGESLTNKFNETKTQASDFFNSQLNPIQQQASSAYQAATAAQKTLKELDALYNRPDGVGGPGIFTLYNGYVNAYNTPGLDTFQRNGYVDMLNRLQPEVDAAINNLNSAGKDFQSNYDTYNALAPKLTGLKNQYDSYTTQLSDLSNQINSLNQQNTNLSNELGTNVEKFNSQVATDLASYVGSSAASGIKGILEDTDTAQSVTPDSGGIEQLAQTQPETIAPPTQQLAQETTGGLDQLINAINNPETTSSYTGTNVASTEGGTGLPPAEPTEQDYEQLGVGLPTGLTDTTDQGGVDVEQPGIPSLINQDQTGNGYQQGEGAFLGTNAGTVASDQTSSGIDNLLNFGQGEGAFTGTGAGTVASDQTTGGTGMGDYDLSGFEGIDMTGGQQDTYQASNQEEENISTIPIDAGQGEGAFPGTEPGTVATDQLAGNTGLTPSFWDRASQITGLSPTALKWLGAGLGATGLASLLGQQQKAPAPTPYTGPLANIRYNPATYTPYTYKPYADGGVVEHMSSINAIGANTGYPMANIQRGTYAVPYQQPMSQNVVTGASDTRVDPYTGEEKFAAGGIADLGGYSDGGRLLRGPGDGVSDSIPAVIGGKQPARLADGEFVIPARIVSELGNGSTEAGARQLYAMMDRIQAARRKTTGKDKVAANTKAAKHLPA